MYNHNCKAKAQNKIQSLSGKCENMKTITIQWLIEYHINEIMSKPKPTKTELKRVTKALNYLSNPNDDGRYGKALEALFVSKSSRKTACAAQGKIDNYFWLNGKRYPIEYKTNGGRIEHLYSVANPERKYIMYALTYRVPVRERKDGSIAGGELRVINPIVMTVKDFLEVIEKCHAYKFPSHADKNDKEKAVAVSSKKMYEVLKNYPIPFHPDTRYTSDDFDAIELF